MTGSTLSGNKVRQQKKKKKNVCFSLEKVRYGRSALIFYLNVLSGNFVICQYI